MESLFSTALMLVLVLLSGPACSQDEVDIEGTGEEISHSEFQLI